MNRARKSGADRLMKSVQQRIGADKMRAAARKDAMQQRHDEMQDRARLKAARIKNRNTGPSSNKNRNAKPSSSYSSEAVELPEPVEKKLKKMSKGLKGSSKGHAGQAKYIDKVLKRDQQNEGKAMDDAIEKIKQAFTPEKNAQLKKDMAKKRMDALNKEDVKEASEKMLSSYASKASNASKHRGLPTKKVDNRYSGVALAHDKIAKAGKLGTTAMRVSKAKVAAKEDVDVSFENFVAVGSGVAPMAQTRPRMVPKKKKVQEVHQGKTHMQGFIDRRSKGIKSKPIDKDRFFGKKKKPEPEDKEKPLDASYAYD
jgi:hypothetical protein